ncbi:hypothetical protein J4440_01495 [Candidatus Woesearchaeota archaeon]|nr:hypothetical protein [Candidatus Woesearchaeota archaeon]
MVHTDKIVKDLELLHEGVFDLKELLNIIKEFFKRHDYDLTEKSYNSTTKDGLKTTVLKWDFDRKVDDYNQCFAKLSIELNNYKEGFVDAKKVIDGRLKFVINAEIQRDYDQKWKTNPLRKIARAVYDRYVIEEKQDRVSKELKSIIDNLKKEIKQYLGI